MSNKICPIIEMVLNFYRPIGRFPFSIESFGMQFWDALLGMQVLSPFGIFAPHQMGAY
jgi:hypothetical protein